MRLPRTLLATTNWRSLLLAIGALTSLAACAPAVGPYQMQASEAAYACQQGSPQACQDYQAIAPVANAEAYQAQQNAAVGTAVAAGAIGLGAAIASSNNHHYHGGYHGGYRRPPPRHYHRSGYRRPPPHHGGHHGGGHHGGHHGGGHHRH